MKQILKKGGAYLLQIILTAIASALVALLNNYISAHTGTPTPTISPADTGAIGGFISTSHISLKEIKINYFS